MNEIKRTVFEIARTASDKVLSFSEVEKVCHDLSPTEANALLECEQLEDEVFLIILKSIERLGDYGRCDGDGADPAMVAAIQAFWLEAAKDEMSPNTARVLFSVMSQDEKRLVQKMLKSEAVGIVHDKLSAMGDFSRCSTPRRLRQLHAGISPSRMGIESPPVTTDSERRSQTRRRGSSRSKKSKAGKLRDYVEQIPCPSPKEMENMLISRGYRGQERARRSLCLFAYRHVRRLQDIYVRGIPREGVNPKANALLMGPTGCGKTYLAELLFEHILGLPTTIVDVTGFSETGYVGKDTTTILSHLCQAAGNNPLLASVGVVCLDEFDKLASSSSSVRFQGQGTTKDVSGSGVQRELLRMMERGTISVPKDFNNTMYSKFDELPVDDIAFIACGAFSGFKSVANSFESKPRMGFGCAEIPETERIAVTLDEAEVMNVEAFQEYGFLPELIGRFTHIVALRPLDRATLKEILVANVIDKFVREFAREGIELVTPDATLDVVVEASFQRQTGARGLGSALTAALQDLAYQYFGMERSGKVVLTPERLEEVGVVA